VVARALVNRGIAKGHLGDPEGEIGDYTAAVELKGAPAEAVAGALTRRGSVHHNLGRYEEALKDFTLSLEIPDLPKESQIHTIFHRSMTHRKLGKLEEALADYTLCAQSGILHVVHNGLQSTVRLLLSEKRGDEALAWVRRFHELEPREASLDTRLEARLDIIRAASGVASLDDTSRLVDALLEADPEELRARLQFLKPGLELARTNDESVLAKLPEDERKIAKEIARSLAEAARPPMAQPPS
jgi:tetratricopeptide (TPR) repeat protein